MTTKKLTKLLALYLPYILLGLVATNFGEAWRLAEGKELGDKIMAMMGTIPLAFANPLLSLHPLDLLIGFSCGAGLRLAVYLRSKNAKKYRHGMEYGSARWGTAKDILVMLGTGCRIGEVLGLRWQDVDFKNRTISINHNLVYRVQEDGTCTNHVNSPKTKAGIRIIPMIDEVFDAFLEEYQYQKVIGFCTDEIDGYSGFVFCTGDGKVYLPNAINRTIRSICADYNKEEESKAKEENRDPVLLPKFSCHILRHTFCTRFCENETNLKVIQEIMGHADISTTMDVYAEATQEKKKESMTSLQSALLVR